MLERGIRQEPGFRSETRKVRRKRRVNSQHKIDTGLRGATCGVP